MITSLASPACLSAAWYVGYVGLWSTFQYSRQLQDVLIVLAGIAGMVGLLMVLIACKGCSTPTRVVSFVINGGMVMLMAFILAHHGWSHW